MKIDKNFEIFGIHILLVRYTKDYPLSESEGVLPEHGILKSMIILRSIVFLIVLLLI